MATPMMATTPINVLKVPIFKYHDGNDPMTHVKKLIEVCITNRENLDVHIFMIGYTYLEKTSYKLACKV